MSSRGLKPGLLAYWGIVGKGLHVSSSWGCVSATRGQDFKCIREILQTHKQWSMDSGAAGICREKGQVWGWEAPVTMHRGTPPTPRLLCQRASIQTQHTGTTARPVPRAIPESRGVGVPKKFPEGNI